MAGVLDLDLFAGFHLDLRKVRRPKLFLYGRLVSLILICLLIILVMLIDLHFIQTCMVFLSFHCFQRVSMTPELLSDEDSVNSYMMVVQILFLYFPFSNSACLFILE